jgi:Raf kinase inhibitor-like YbhB/YbcL family protein
MTLTIRSPSFTNGSGIPQRHTCEGADVSPPLELDGAPAGTRSLALVVDDPDAPDPRAPTRVWVHWVLYDLPPDTRALPDALAASRLPKGTREGLNDWNRTGWGGPCPPIGRHRYFFKLYALDVELGDLRQPSKADLLAAMHGHVLAEAQVMGTYEKRKP